MFEVSLSVNLSLRQGQLTVDTETDERWIHIVRAVERKLAFVES